MTGNVSLCSLVCDLSRNIRYSSGVDPGRLVLVERGIGVNSDSSGLCSVAKYL